jgi:hypothetical protein
VQTDLSPQLLSQLACIGIDLKPENIIFSSFPQDIFEQTRVYDPVFKKEVFAWSADYDILRDYVEKFNNGKWPYPIFMEPTDQGESINCN